MSEKAQRGGGAGWWGERQVGRAGLALGAVALAGLLALSAAGRRDGRPAAITVWAFDEGAVGRYPKTFEGRPVVVSVTPAAILNARVGARVLARQAGGSGGSYVVELDTGSGGRFLGQGQREFLLSAPEVAGLLPARVAAWGGIGVPTDVHPVVLAWREDLWRAAGLDVRTATTWDELITLCRRYEATTGRRSIELPRTSGAVVYLMLQQAGLWRLGTDGVPRLGDGAVAGLVAKYAGWVGEGEGLGAPPGRSAEDTARQLLSGEVAMLVAPDWKLGQLRRAAPGLAEKLALARLPAVDLGGGRLGAAVPTWGGTAVAIPADTPDEAVSRRLLQAVATDNDSAVAGWCDRLVWPALTAAWDDPRMTRPDSFFDPATPPSRLLRTLSGQIAPVRQSPATSAALTELNLAVFRAVSGRLSEKQVRELLEQAETRLHRREGVSRP